MDRPPVTLESLKKIFEGSDPFIKSLVFAFFSQPKKEAHQAMRQLIESCKSDERLPIETRNDIVEGLEFLISGSEKMTDEEREFLRLRIIKELKLK